MCCQPTIQPPLGVCISLHCFLHSPDPSASSDPENTELLKGSLVQTQVWVKEASHHQRCHSITVLRSTTTVRAMVCVSQDTTFQSLFVQQIFTQYFAGPKRNSPIESIPTSRTTQPPPSCGWEKIFSLTNDGLVPSHQRPTENGERLSPFFQAACCYSASCCVNIAVVSRAGQRPDQAPQNLGARCLPKLDFPVLGRTI